MDLLFGLALFFGGVVVCLAAGISLICALAFGLAVFFAVCLFIIWRGIAIARRCKDTFGYLLSAGITLVYGIQVIVNALVVSGAIPPTGLPLPLVSSGNTSLIITMASMGVLYNVSANN